MYSWMMDYEGIVVDVTGHDCNKGYRQARIGRLLMPTKRGFDQPINKVGVFTGRNDNEDI